MELTPMMAQILRHINATGPCTVNELAAVVGRRRSTVYMCVRTMYLRHPRRLWKVGKRHDVAVRRRMSDLWYTSPSAPASVTIVRRESGVPVAAATCPAAPTKPTAPSGVLWADLDWNLTDAELAPVCGCTRQGVARVRASRGIGAPAPRPDAAPSGIAWLDLDWSLSNVRLAVVAGCTPQHVSRKRRELGKPASEPPHIAPDGRPWSAQDWTLTDAEIARRLAMTVATVAKRRRRHAPVELRRAE